VAAPQGPEIRPDRWRRLRRGPALALLLGGGILLVLLSALIGAVPVPLQEGLTLLLHHLSGGALFPSPCPATGRAGQHCAALDIIVWEIYLPEVLLALLAGAALGVSGAALQGIFRNPLADPFLLGISSGGTLGVAVVLVYQVGLADEIVTLPLFAFMGATATGLIILVAARGRWSSVETLLLTGVAVAYLLSAALSLVLLYNAVSAEQVTFWLEGNLALASWTVDELVLGCLLVLGTLTSLYGRELNLLQLGPDVAQSAGVDARRVRVRVILLASLTAAVAVAFTGVIGFVGLISPHIVRRIATNDYRVVVPASALVGALFLLGARDLNYLIFPSSGLPLGIFTAFGGAPFFLYLLYRQRRSVTMGGA
jgi:iron complex transport system permease protein